MEKEKKLIYTSLGGHVKSGERTNSRKSKKRHSQNKSNHFMESAAKAYLNNPKLLPRNQIKSLIKTSRNNHEKSSFLLTKLAEELQRRDVEGSFFRKNRNKDKRFNDIITRATPSHHNFVSQVYRPVTSSKSKRYQNASFSKHSVRESHNIDFVVLEEHQNRKKQLVVPRLRQSLKDLYSVKRSLPSPKNIESSKLVRSCRNDFTSNPSHSKNISRSPKNKKLNQNGSQESINSSISQIKKQNPLTARNIKGFIVNERQSMVSELLLPQGWKTLNLQSQRFMLKWTYNESYKDYETVRNRNKINKNGKVLYNHIRNNKLVKKDEFHQLSRELMHKNINVNSFIPQTFLLASEKQDFLIEYHRRTLMILVHKHFQYFTQEGVYGPQDQHIVMEDVVDEMVRLGSAAQDQNLIQHLVDNQCKVVAQISLLYYMVVMGCNLWICQEGYDSEQFDRIYSAVCEDQTIKAMLITCSKVDLPFEQYMVGSPHAPKQQAISLKNGYIRTTKTFMKPHKKIVMTIKFLHEYLMNKFEDYEVGGHLNLWIVKPCSGSKGCGIEILDKPERINQILDTTASQNKIIQKYIENIWVLSPKMAINDQQIIKHSIVGRKFDIRQWVLMTQKQCYIFSHFYAKICSKTYDINFSNDPQIHLANYTINKESFINGDPSQSVCSQDQLYQIFKRISMKDKFENLKNLIKSSISQIVQQAMQQCEPIEGTFEIVGFDIVIDQNVKPWIIECNMSPACDTRTHWLREMKRSMTAGALQIVLQKQNFINPCTQQYRWEKLESSLASKKDIKDSQNSERLQVVGRKISNKKMLTKKFRKETLRKNMTSTEI